MPLVAARDSVLTPPHVGTAHLRRLPREPTARPLAPRRTGAAQGPRPPRRVHAGRRRVGRRPEGVARAGPHLHGRARLQGLPAARRLQGDAAGLVGPEGAARRHGPGRHLGRRPLRRRTEPLRRAGAARLLHAALQRLAVRARAGKRRAPGRHPHPARQRRRRGDVRRAPARREAGRAGRPGRRLPRRGRGPALQRSGVGAPLERLDSTFKRHRFWTKSITTEPPSSYWYRQGHATFIEDHPGVKLRHEAGLENILWSSDYPHSDTTWPRSREAVAEQFADVPPRERDLIVWGNAARLYGIE